jgi:amino acid transporter
MKIYVGVLAATILFIATNAGVIGASRFTYAMASHRQLPEVFRRLHRKFKTPYISLLFFAGVIPMIVLLPGKTAFLGTMYSFGAMLSFTIAHASIVALRYKDRDAELITRPGPTCAGGASTGAVRGLRRAPGPASAGGGRAGGGDALGGPPGGSRPGSLPTPSTGGACTCR